jgi:hypothetical protein
LNLIYGMRALTKGAARHFAGFYPRFRDLIEELDAGSETEMSCAD